MLAEKLSEILGPNLMKTFFCNSGTEVVQSAMRLSRKHSRRYQKVALFKGHRGSLGSLSLGAYAATDEVSSLFEFLDFVLVRGN